MRPRKGKRMIKWILSALAAVVAGFVFYAYADLNGYPWEKARIKKEAVRYMLEKYGMEAEASGSSFNFKFDTYAAHLYDARDGDKRIIRVERTGYFEGERYAGKRLEDNYAEVYWGRETERRLMEAFPDIYAHEGVRDIAVHTVYQLSGMDEGIGPDRDADGAAVPAKPVHEATWDIDLAEDGLTDSFLKELFLATREMGRLGIEANLYVTAGPDQPIGQEPVGTTRYLNLEAERFGNIASAEELKASIKEY